MELMTQNLPSGYQYQFPSIHLEPMKFAQVLEYMENVPSVPMERFYFDYCIVKEDDENIDNLLFIDLEYVIFFKKAITISEDLEITSTIVCPRCGSQIKLRFKLSDIEFTPIEPQVMNGIQVKFHNEYCNVSIPTVKKFMDIFSKYRMYKKLTDLRMIKLISLFEGTDPYLQKYETYVTQSTHKDITVLAMLEDLYFDTVKPMHTICRNCVRNIDYSQFGDDLSEEDKQAINFNYGGVTVRIDSIAVNFFQEILENNRLTDEEILLREVRQDT